ncbi:nuclear transport factor 2 family protein [Nonomuraea sp. M3C6]|uniref:Nuclear transport factor 2 family protein n=1 Tax=Nonomuraea marmarensis TaxID=3351344 RepID=A0ABW7ASI9_9ACTN
MTTTDLITQYLDIWNERDPAARLKLMEEVFTEDVFYADPDNAGLRGHAALSEAIGQARDKLGDLRFALDTVIGTHHDRALFTWRLDRVATGYDVVEFDADRISSIVGFFA